MHGFEVLRKLADGSAAEMFLAREERSQDQVLLEVIRPELTHDMEVYGRFLDEAKERQHLAHPNLLRRRSCGCAKDGRIFVVTEPLSSDHLGALLSASGPLSSRRVGELVVPLCDALAYLHGRGLVHGNLCPSNVFPGPPPKLMDTGLTLFRSQRSVPTSLVLVRPEYLAPERVRGLRGTPLSDIYGLGVLMFEMLTGRPPFARADPSETRRMHLDVEPPLLAGGAEPLAPVVMRCLSKNPARRYPHALALQAAMRDALGFSAPPAPPTPRRGRVSPTLIEVRQEDAPASFKADAAEALSSKEVDLGDLLAAELAAQTVAVEPPPVRGEPVGEVLGQYELVDLLGQGGMGRVFLARHVQLGREVALKVLKPQFAKDPEHLRRFFQEARAVNRVNNPHIVEITDFVSAPSGQVYCVMEPLRGQSLRDLMKKGPVSIGVAVHVVRQVCEALAAAHAVGVVHRDVKPDNIFLVERGEERLYVKLLDFGVAKLRADSETDLEHTRTGVVVGTPSFMAPEQALGEAVDHRADLYSVGTVLYTLLKGATPFIASSLGPLVARLVTQPPAPLPVQAASGEVIPEGLRAIVLRCLEKKPKKRFDDMMELARVLEPYDPGVVSATPAQASAPMAASAPSLSALPPPLPTSRERERSQRGGSWRFWVLVALLAAAATALGAQWALPALRGLAPAPESSAPVVTAPEKAAAPVSVEPAVPVKPAAPPVKSGPAKKRRGH